MMRRLSVSTALALTAALLTPATAGRGHLVHSPLSGTGLPAVESVIACIYEEGAPAVDCRTGAPLWLRDGGWRPVGERMFNPDASLDPAQFGTPAVHRPRWIRLPFGL